MHISRTENWPPDAQLAAAPMHQIHNPPCRTTISTIARRPHKKPRNGAVFRAGQASLSDSQ